MLSLIHIGLAVCTTPEHNTMWGGVVTMHTRILSGTTLCYTDPGLWRSPQQVVFECLLQEDTRKQSSAIIKLSSPTPPPPLPRGGDMIVIQWDLMRHRPCILSNHIHPISPLFPTCARLSQTSATRVFLKTYFPTPSWVGKYVEQC